MTDYTKLIDAVIDYNASDERPRAALQSAIDALQSKLGDAIQSSAHWQHQFTDAQAENERLRVQLAGCGVAAMQNTEGSKAQRAEKGSYGYSESYADVCSAVDREIDLRTERDALQSRLDGTGKGEPDGNALLQAIARGWCSEKNSGKVMDALLALAIRDEVQKLYAAPKALAPRFTECRIELVGAIHTLASHYENRLGRLDPEDRKLAEGDIAHAMATAAKWNWNGNGIGGTP